LGDFFALVALDFSSSCLLVNCQHCSEQHKRQIYVSVLDHFNMHIPLRRHCGERSYALVLFVFLSVHRGL